jgi:hypothetical protein
VLLEKKHPDVKVATVVDEHYSTPCRVSRDERSKHISFFLSFFVGRESERERQRIEKKRQVCCALRIKKLL